VPPKGKTPPTTNLGASRHAGVSIDDDPITINSPVHPDMSSL
jgi:hypothetical protein